MSVSEAVLRDDPEDGRAKPETVEISVLASGDEARWDRFVRNSPGGTFYHLAGWRRIVENELGHRSYYLVAEGDGRIVGVLPLVHVNSQLFGNFLISIPFLVYGGPIGNSADTTRALVERACELGNELGVDHIELRNRCSVELPDPDRWLSLDSHVTFRKPLDPDPEANLKAIPRKQRAMIRKGIQAGLTWEIDEDVSRLYPAMLECKRNLGTPFFGKRYLQAIKDTFGKDVEILTVLHGSSVVCSVMSFRFGDEILPYYGGGGELARDYKGNDFMYWCVMEKACRDGVRVFDYGRSQVGSGAYRFKKHWGFEPEPLAYRQRLVRATKQPNLSPTNPKFELAIRMWKRLPLAVAGRIGPPIASRLG